MTRLPIADAGEAASQTTADGVPGCPDVPTHEGPLNLYRLVANDPPQHVDFMTVEEERRRSDGTKCIRQAVSLFQRRDHLEAMIRNLPVHANKYIAVGTVGAGGDGVKAQTGKPSKGHWSWWPAVGFPRHINFRVV